MRSCGTGWARRVAPSAPEYSWDRVTEQIVDFYHEVRDRVLAERATGR